jgi:hypothetical protein
VTQVCLRSNWVQLLIYGQIGHYPQCQEFQVGLQGLEGSVLEETGLTRFHKEVCAIYTQCNKTIAAIEELWCYRASGISGIPDLADRNRQGDLLYETL